MFRLAQDNDCHWYIIPVENEKEWEDFLNIPEDDERSWNVPSFAQELGGGYQSVWFPMFGTR